MNVKSLHQSHLHLEYSWPSVPFSSPRWPSAGRTVPGQPPPVTETQRMKEGLTFTLCYYPSSEPFTQSPNFFYPLQKNQEWQILEIQLSTDQSEFLYRDMVRPTIKYVLVETTNQPTQKYQIFGFHKLCKLTNIRTSGFMNFGGFFKSIFQANYLPLELLNYLPLGY